MNKHLIVAALATLALAACGDEQPDTPAPGAEVSGSAVPPAAAPAPDSAVAGSAAVPPPDTSATAPQSGAVGAAPTPGTGADHAKDESDEMTKKEESTQMPQPGQANDHSNTREQGGTGVIRP